MTRLIEEEETFKVLSAYYKHRTPMQDSALHDALSRVPTAEPVKHGKWIIRDNPGTGWYRVTCSECGENVTATAPCIGFYPNVRVTWNYCPECGSRMDQ